MLPDPQALPFIDEHGLEVAAPPEAVWELLCRVAERPPAGRDPGALPGRRRAPLPRRRDRHPRSHPGDDAPARSRQAPRRALTSWASALLRAAAHPASLAG